MRTKDKNTQNQEIRLDKWLWAARFYKTRSIAKDMIEGGKVHYNNQRSKPSKLVEVGAMVKLRQGHDEKVVIIMQLCEQRRSAAEAQNLYQETEESIKKREQNHLERKLNSYNHGPERRPDKKQRRDIIKFKHSNN